MTPEKNIYQLPPDLVNTLKQVHLKGIPEFSLYPDHQNPLEMRKLPGMLLEGDEYYSKQAKDKAWKVIIHPFLRAQVESGQPPQNLRGGWSDKQQSDWNRLYRKYLRNRGKKSSDLSAPDIQPPGRKPHRRKATNYRGMKDL